MTSKLKQFQYVIVFRNITHNRRDALDWKNISMRAIIVLLAATFRATWFTRKAWIIVCGERISHFLIKLQCENIFWWVTQVINAYTLIADWFIPTAHFFLQSFINNCCEYFKYQATPELSSPTVFAQCLLSPFFFHPKYRVIFQLKRKVRYLITDTCFRKRVWSSRNDILNLDRGNCYWHWLWFFALDSRVRLRSANFIWFGNKRTEKKTVE